MIKITDRVFVPAEGIWVIEALVELIDGTRTQSYLVAGDENSTDEDTFLPFIKNVWNIK